jgi:hypothetical protein
MPKAIKIKRIAKILNHTKIAAIHLIKNMRINEIPIANPNPTKIQYQF